MAAVAGSVAIATYTSSSAAEQAYDHVPNMTPGTLALAAADTGADAELPRSRAAVEQNYPVSGKAADFGRVWAKQRLLGLLPGRERLRRAPARQAHG